MAAFDFHTLATLIAIAAAAGVFGGVLAGLLGVGGGIVIVPSLYFALSLTGGDTALTMKVAVGTSLATIVFTSLSSSWGHYRRGTLDTALLKKWVPAVLIGVIIGSVLGGLVSGYILLAVFGLVAGFVALDMIIRTPGESDEVRIFPAWIWAITGVFAGGLSAMMGIGGGTICVPVLSALGYDIRRAVGTSAAIGFVIGLPGALIYAWTGLGETGLPPFSLGYVNLLAAAVIIPMSTTFAQVGVRIAHSIPKRALRLAFSCFLMLTSIRMFYDLIGVW